ncbi:MAG: 2-oxoacid:ferredoxin oxidoreductase subunit beta [Bacteroidales bacterium]|jgi:2-oxoglutarate/2-oxoacid ferredoxin oxidoreductase subunit beta|nr:2-oxoacid:ferredoxin oxidoreductase subunit beta [Bacteroidales bacterium]MDD4394531.1 2-oxoacid:ferredoxin oxidoreductase subunit beta [Bacteroidales bacterium]
MSYKTIERTTEQLTKEDFASDQMVKWCPGCGNHAILAAVENVFPQIGYKKENFCVVSGIGCSSRFPYYMNTYGFHSIHGRANAIATGVRLFNRGLSVWVPTGDGDSLAIGGNHFIHVIRRNIDLNIMLFNNEIYGLTKGQYSPTSPMGKITKSSPQGTIEHPFTVGELVLGAQGTFFARVIDNKPQFISQVMLEAAKHDGTSIVEILQNCVIFNNGAHKYITDKEVRDNNQLYLEDGKPMLFGKDKEKGIILGNNGLQVVKLGENGITEKDILVHDMKSQNPGIHLMLAKMKPPYFPIALGVIRSVESPTYDQLLDEQIKTAQENPATVKCVDDLLNSGDTWEI